MTNTLEDFLQHARECDQLARTAKSEDERVMIKQMADTWRLLAERRAKQLKEEL